ncbi:MAG: hypothetical protein J6386_15835 [Candidatus Synoicihabitans palmerolidicus]|nr:hypothetical protein [Candidatus Synoicihabitans palmerolidicus]
MWPETDLLDLWQLVSKQGWTDQFAARWTPGEQGAVAALQAFLQDTVGAQDYPSVRETSRLLPHLHFGEISLRQIWAVTQALGETRGIDPPSSGARVFLSEVGWREFAHHLLFHFPHTTSQPLRSEFAKFPWRPDPGGRLQKAWETGRTGYPLMDAGMRELWATGWMHNRVRMGVASFLVKHLRLPWQVGAQWFWDTLVDADLASNTIG